MSDACINLRGNPDNAEFVAAARDALGQDLPIEPNTTSRGTHCVCWLGPDEWFVMTSQDQRAEVFAKLEAAIVSVHAAVNDLTGGNEVITLKGPDVVEVLAQGCTLDFDAFTVGDCAQTGLGKSGVLLRRDADDEFIVVVRRSFADYLRKWLDHACHSRDIEVR